jgi:hypothetical protein
MVGPVTLLLRVDLAAIQQAEAILEELRRRPIGVTKLMVVWPIHHGQGGWFLASR